MIVSTRLYIYDVFCIISIIISLCMSIFQVYKYYKEDKLEYEVLFFIHFFNFVIAILIYNFMNLDGFLPR